MPNILEFWSITIEELSRAIFGNGSLRGMIFGYVAEIKLRNLLASNEHVTNLMKDDDHDRSRKGDLRIVYKGHEFVVESKSLQTAKNKHLEDGSYSSVSQVDASDKRTVTLPDGSQLQTTNLLVGEFHLLSVNCFTFENKWHFVSLRITTFHARPIEHTPNTNGSICLPPQFQSLGLRLAFLLKTYFPCLTR